MTSKSSPAECYVYITLPGETEFVTAGKFALGEDRRGISTGTFVYGRSYRARQNAVPIDPLELELGTKPFQTTLLKGVFGALRDATPDYWGRHVIDIRRGKAQPDELDYLLYSPDDRAGALGFGLNQEPPAPRREFNRTMDLDRLQGLADAIIADEDLPDGPNTQLAQDLLQLGTSMGGARPKTVVADDAGLWIAKFDRRDDEWNHARVERAMLVLARACGLQTPESKVTTVGNREVLLVKRFDRQKVASGYRRARMLSALTLLRAGDTHQDRDKWSYILFVEELRRISSQPKTDAPELFRRMCFNALISNLDDHPRNHAVIAADGDWILSPAYDLLPSTPVGIERRDLALTCGDMGRYAQVDNLLSQGARFLLERDEAKKIIDDMEQTVKARWHDVARKEGVTETDCEKIVSAFAYPGFRLGATGQVTA
ncbi:MAG: type II toxin-antitoxin system HipA family toxin [Gammaproteobacteria bacterium]